MSFPLISIFNSFLTRKQKDCIVFLQIYRIQHFSLFLSLSFSCSTFLGLPLRASLSFSQTCRILLHEMNVVEHISGFNDDNNNADNFDRFMHIHAPEIDGEKWWFISIFAGYFQPLHWTYSRSLFMVPIQGVPFGFSLEKRNNRSSKLISGYLETGQNWS